MFRSPAFRSRRTRDIACVTRCTRAHIPLCVCVYADIELRCIPPRPRPHIAQTARSYSVRFFEPRRRRHRHRRVCLFTLSCPFNFCTHPYSSRSAAAGSSLVRSAGHHEQNKRRRKRLVQPSTTRSRVVTGDNTTRRGKPGVTTPSCGKARD